LDKAGRNILYVGGFELPDKNAAAQRVIANAKLLKSLGHEVKFLGVDKSQPHTTLDASYKKIYEFDAWSIPYPNSISSWIKYVTKIDSIRHLIKSKNLDPDIIIIYNFPAIASSKLIKYCKKNKIKLIADITEWYGHRIRNLLGLIKYIDSELRMRYYNKNLDGIICISKYLYEYYKDTVKNTILLPPLVDLTDEKWNVDIIPKKDKKVIVYAGSPGGKDKINLLIDAMLEIENISQLVEFRVIGITKIEFFSRYNYYSAAQINAISGFSLFLGRLPHREVIKEVTNAAFSAFLRENNKTNNAGFPTKFVESISCGTPVLTNKTSNIEDYLIEGKNGYWLEVDSKNLKKFLLEIINKEQQTIESMKYYCRDTKIFDFTLNKDEIKKIYE